MKREFYIENRKELYRNLEPGSLLIMFSGHAPIKTNDENYPFFTNRNFLYLTGVEQENTILMAVVGDSGAKETLYMWRADDMRRDGTAAVLK